MSLYKVKKWYPQVTFLDLYVNATASQQHVALLPSIGRASVLQAADPEMMIPTGGIKHWYQIIKQVAEASGLSKSGVRRPAADGE